MRRSTRYTLLAIALAVLVLGLLVFLRQKAPPEVARLLPESDAIVYADLRPLRAATHFDRTAVTRSGEYQRFTDATGIVLERDLDRVAFAFHRMADPHGPNGAVAFSEVFEGRFDRPRLEAYLRGAAQGTEEYAGRTIYAIPSENRTVRVAVLGYDMVAASNMPTAEQIHSILDRVRAAASPFSGSSLLEARYRDVPAFASAWGIGRIGLPFATPDDAAGRLQVLGLTVPLRADATFVASLRYQGSVHLRVEELAGSEDAASRTADALRALLKLVRTVEQAQQPQPRTGSDAALQQFLGSVQVETKGERAVITATVPAEALRHLSSSQP